jgi:hypothetical protein
MTDTIGSILIDCFWWHFFTFLFGLNRFTSLLAGEDTESHEFETNHPYPSGTRVLKQTLHIPGATGMYSSLSYF